MPRRKKRSPEEKIEMLLFLCRRNKHTFLKPANGRLGRMQKDFYLIPADLVEQILGT